MAADYKFINDVTILRVADGAAIPVEPLNRDYQDYLEWVALGNVADAADVVDPWIAIRAERDRLLTASDWTQLADSPLSLDAMADWAAYRADLRDIPQDFENAEDVVFPTQP